MRARSLLALGDRTAAREAVERAIVALSHGFGRENVHTRAAVALRDSVAR